MNDFFISLFNSVRDLDSAMAFKTLKIFHTADVHLGLKFSSYPESVSKTLSQARFETLDALVKIANAQDCHLFVVAGDLFDHLRVLQKDILRAAKILGQFSGVVAVLPGNHDYVTSQEDDLWKIFQSTHQDRLLVLSERRPYSLQHFDLDACIYPAPCQNKHSKTHAVGWITESSRQNACFRIGLAHGSFECLTPDTEGEYYPMKKEDLTRSELDLWLMGHIHVQFPPRPGELDRIFYPGTPEPDGFDCRHEGKAWMIELSETIPQMNGTHRKQIRTQSISTGKYRFHHETIRNIQSLRDLETLKERFQSPEYRRMLLKLSLQGTLPREDYSQWMTHLEQLKTQFLYLEPDTTSITLQLTPDDIEREFTRESFPYLLLSQLAQNLEDRDALQMAYELMKDVQKQGDQR